MKRKIFQSMILLSLLAVLLSFSLEFAVLYSEFSLEMRSEVKNEAEYVLAGFEMDGEVYLQNLENRPNKSRITLISKDGSVLYDSKAEESGLQNHLDRPEIISAFQVGRGEAERYSSTLGEKTYYYAIALSDNLVLRLSMTTDSIFSKIFSALPLLTFIAVTVFCLSMLLARTLTKRVIVPLNNLDLENPMASEAYEELSPLLRRIDDQNHRIERQISEIKEQKEEFLQIAENMSEGLAVLDANGFILTVNESAKKLLGTGDFPLAGRHVLALSRSEQLREAAEAALKGKAFERDIESGQKMLRIFLNPVFEGNKVSGAILLILDITEKYKAEKTRREFSANVSHELKTPLTSISGYAELMKNGMVKSEDIERFSGRIYEESTRLLSLIEDIIRLSKLDEGDIRSEKRKIGLLESAENVSKRLFDQAQKHNIKISVEGEEAFILAVPQLLEELIYNLLENAIKYNKEDGEVTITISKNEDRATLLVADTGIGIPSEQRERVFERFYRVDKSHSKETGGTGLGLSIVKHIAAYHSATIDLQSKEGEGTIVTISFPRN